MSAQIPRLTIVVRLPNWVGDVCMVLPSLQVLAQTGVSIVIAGKPFVQPLLQGLPHKSFVPLSGKAWTDSQRLRRTIRSLRTNSIHKTSNRTLGLLFPDSLTSALTFWIAGIASLGYRDDGRSLLLRWPINKSPTQSHAVLKWYQLACHAINIWALSPSKPTLARPPFYRYRPSESDISLAQEMLHRYKLEHTPFVLIAPTATGLHKGQVKVWPAFGELSQLLMQRGIRVVTCPPKHERQQAYQAAPEALMLDPLPLGAFAYLSTQAQLVVCNDSGVSHLAAIAGAHQLTLFGVTDPQHTGPWSDHAQSLGKMGQWPTLNEVLLQCLASLDSKQVIP